MSLCLLCACGGNDDVGSYDDGSRFESVTAETKGTIHSLASAYELGFLSKDDLKKIAYYYNVENKATYPVALSESVGAAIESSYAEYWNADEKHSDKATAEDFSVTGFWGYYNDCCAVHIESMLWAYPAVPVDEWREIGGVQFHVTGYDFPIVWKISE